MVLNSIAEQELIIIQEAEQAQVTQSASPTLGHVEAEYAAEPEPIVRRTVPAKPSLEPNKPLIIIDSEPQPEVPAVTLIPSRQSTVVQKVEVSVEPAILEIDQPVQAVAEAPNVVGPIDNMIQPTPDAQVRANTLIVSEESGHEESIEAPDVDQTEPVMELQSLLATPEAPVVTKLEALFAPLETPEVSPTAYFENLEPEQIEVVEELIEELVMTLESLPVVATSEERQVAIEKLEAVVTELLEQLGLQADEATIKQIIANCLEAEKPAEIETPTLSIEARNRLGTREYMLATQPHRQLGSYTLLAYAA